MTYDQLMQSLNKLTIYSSSYSFFSIVAVLIEFVIFFILYMLLDTFLSLKPQKDKETGKRLSRWKSFEKELATNTTGILGFVTFLLLFAIAIAIGIIYYKDHARLTLQDKQEVINNEIYDWEHGKELKQYIQTLPTKRLVLDNKTSIIEEDSNYEVTIPSSKGKKNQTQTLTFTPPQVYKVRKENTHKGEPKKTYIEYSVLPYNITYNYPKGKMIPKRLVIVW